MIKKIKDVVTWMPPDEVPRHLRDLAQRVHRLIDAIATSVDRSNQRDAVTNIGKRSAAELERLASLYPSPIEGVAWCTRNLFELNLVLRYILKDPKNINVWMGQAANDEKEIIEGLLTLASSTKLPEIQVLRQRLSQIDEICKLHGIDPQRPFRMDTLAAAVGRADDYKALYKLFSKYVHPSSWLVNVPAENSRSADTLNVFLINATLYGGDTYGRLEKWLKQRRPTH
jgi:hypothetical protein